MKDGLIRVFPRRTKWTPTDDLAFVGDPPLFRPKNQPVYVSVTFTWDLAEGERLKIAWSQYYPDTKIGGPAFDDSGGEFVPGRFLKDGVTITSRGCSDACPWCFVPSREGRIREFPIHDGYIIQDNNLLACSRPHIEAVFEMLKCQKKAAKFSGGLAAHKLRDWHRTLIDSIKIDELWFAFDSTGALRHLERAAKILDGIPIYKRRCYVLMGYDGEPVHEAEKRVKRVYELGFLPFAQAYKSDVPKVYSAEMMALVRKWSRPAAYRESNTISKPPPNCEAWWDFGGAYGITDTEKENRA